MSKQKPKQVEMLSAGRPKKYDFSGMNVGESKEFRGLKVNRPNIYGSAVAYSKKYQGGKWKFSCSSGKYGVMKVVIVKRLK